jgi:hypothetical protein
MAYTNKDGQKINEDVTTKIISLLEEIRDLLQK